MEATHDVYEKTSPKCIRQWLRDGDFNNKINNSGEETLTLKIQKD